MVEISLEFNIPPTVVGTVVTSAGGSSFFLEEYEFMQAQKDIRDIIDVLVKFGMDEEYLNEQLAIMNNDDFADFCRSATAVTPHIAIDNAKKTVVPGALWFEETLPPNTLLYTMLLSNSARGNNVMDANAVLSCLSTMFTGDNKPYIQVGGNETVGMGWCRVTEVRL